MDKSLIDDNKKRVEVLYKKHHKKFIKYLNTLTKDEDESEDYFSQMMLTLLEKPNKNIFDGDCFNLYYIQKMLYSKFINQINQNNRRYGGEFDDEFDVIIDEEYDYEKDYIDEQLLQLLLDTITNAKKTRLDKYINEYEKVHLYKQPVKIAAKLRKITPNTLYHHFQHIDKIIHNELKIKSLKIIDGSVS